MAHAVGVQRLFSMFPRGLPGLALLFLRVSVASALLLEAYSQRMQMSGGLQIAVVVVSVSLCAGFFTPIGALLALALQAAIWSMHGFGAAASMSVYLLDAIALALLGPGAYSI